MTLFQVGGRSDSDVYIKMKLKAAADIGIKADLLKLAK
jgi:5,10-methylene-tetrahydrofolate dehydrogenase/methenyl tetrahydrofolate cyclohydrolase